MSNCRFMHQNLIQDPDQISLSSARPGLVGMPAPRASGSATAYAAGEHTGSQDQVFMVEIDSLAAGSQVGQATFRWRRASQETWEMSGQATTDTLITLADGVKIKWVSGPGADFALGDSWSILATQNFGAAALLDRDRDTAWEAEGCSEEHVTIDLGQAQQAKALVLADHNLTAGATVTLLANTSDAWEAPAWSQSLTVTAPHLVYFLDQTYRFWRLLLEDPENPAGALWASLLFLGPYFQPSRTFKQRHERSTVAGRSLTATDAGKLAGGVLGLGETFSLSFSGLGSADLDGFVSMYRAIHDPASGRLTPLFFTPFCENAAETFYCLPGATFSRTQLHLNRYALELNLEEVIISRV
jgi:hypothetical protein